MSTTIDERVVEMRFDNRQFENNVQTSMSTLDKLKQKLNFNGASKGLENINTAAKNVNMTGLGNAVETVRARFSALDVMAVTALSNITNQAVNAGKRIVSALTIDPVKTGLSEYETKINAIQVIQANTRGKNDMNDITSALEELNTYADKTIYNFAQMTDNIGKFTAQGLDVHQASKAVQGLANLAAASGASASDMARATYQISQSLGGTIKLIDWNSLRNANMATQTLKDTLMDLARVNGIAIDDMIAKHGTFEQTLSEGWLSGEMFSEAMNIYSGVYSEAELKAKGFTDAQVKNFIELAKMAESAATEVKTFTQLWDVLKETAQSGWTQTWELLIGDFETAKKDLTKLQNYLSDIINAWSHARNFVLGGALNFSKPWATIMEKLEGSSLGKIKKVAETVGDLTDKLEYYQDVVRKVWRGDYKNSDTGRFELLEKAGYDHRVVQELVNKGNEYKLTVEDVEAAHKKFGLTMEKTSEETKETTKAVKKLTDEELKNAGLTEDEIDLYRALEKEADRLGITMEELTDKMSKNDGRSLLIDSLKNIWEGLSNVVKVAKEAWNEIFDPPTKGEVIVRLYSMIEALNEFTKSCTLVDKDGKLTETAEKIRRVFKGLFAAIDIVAKITGGALKIAFQVVKGLLEYFNVDILEVAASVGDAIVKFNDWLDSLIDVQGVVEVIGPIIQTVVQAISDLVNIIGQSEGFKGFLELLKSIGKSFGEWFKGLRETDDIPKYIFEGLLNGIIEWTPKVVKALFELGAAIIDAICEVLGIQSPSTVFIAIGGFIMAGLAIGIREGWGEVWQIITDIFTNIVTFIQNLDLGTLIAGAVALGITGSVWKISSALEAFASPFDGLGDFLEELGDGVKAALKGMGKMFKGIGSSFKASAWKKRGAAMLMFAGAIAILAGSIWLLTQLDSEAMRGAVGAIGALAGILVALAGAMALMGKIPDLKIGKLSGTMFAFSVAIAALAAATWIISTIDPDAMDKCFQFILGFAAIIVSMIALAGKIGSAGGKFESIGGTIVGVAVAMLLMAGVAKIVGGMDPSELIIGLGVMIILGGIITGLIAATKLAGKDRGKIATTLIGISLAMLILVGLIKIIGNMDPAELIIGLGVVIILGGIITGLIAATKLAGKDISKVGTTILAISFAMLLLVGVMALIGTMKPDMLLKGIIGVAALGALVAILIKVVGSWGGGQLAKIGTTIVAISIAMLLLAGVAKIIETMSWEGMLKAGIGLGAMVIIVAALVGIVKTAGSDVAKIGATLLMLSGSIAILAGVALVLSLISWEGLFKGVGAITVLGLIMMGLIAVCKNAKDCKDELIVLTVTIAVLAGAVALLSLIEPERLLPASVALGILMGMFGLMVKMTGTVNTSMGSIIIMAAVVAGLAGILYLLSGIPVESSLGTVTALSILLLSMSAALMILSKTNTISPMALVAIGVMTLIVGLLGGLLYLLQGMPVLPTIVIASSLSELLIVMALVCAIVSKIPAAAAIQGALGLAAFIGIMGGVIAALGALSYIPGFNELIASGGETLALIGYAIGKFVGSIIGGFGAGISSGLPAIGANLSAFMINAMPFIVGVKTLVDSSLLEKVGILSGAILALTGADLVNSLATLMPGEQGLATLGRELSMFMINAMPFIAGASLIKPESMQGVKALADAAITLTSANLIDGLARLFGAETSLSAFGAELAAFGPHMATYAEAVSEVNGEQVLSSANAVKALAEAFAALPSSGGFLADFFGEQTPEEFGAQLVAFGDALRQYSWKVTDLNYDAISQSATAAKSLSDIANNLPKTGGFLQQFLGETSMEDFGAQLKSFGAGLKDYSAEVAELDTESITASVDAAKGLSDIANALPKSGGFLQKFLGETTIEDFGAQLKNFGTGLKDYGTEVENLDVGKIKESVGAAEALKDLANALPDSGWLAEFFGNTTMDEFGTQLAGFGAGMKEYSDSIAGCDFAKMATATTQFTRIKNLAQEVSGTDFGGLTDLGNALGDLAESGIDGFISAFEDSYDKASKAAKKLVTEMINAIKEKHESFTKQGSAVMKKFTSGIKESKDKAKSAFADILKTMVASIKNKYEDFYGAGSYLVTGFAAGISDNDYKAEAKARAMAKAAKSAAEKELKIKSPSREFYKIGKFAGMGFVNALIDYGEKAYVASADMASSAKTGLSDAISTVRNLIEGDWDVQPTIRPVLDLADVRAGAGSIGNLLNIGSSVGVLANVGAISSTMNRNGQNGKNGEVVGAINRLRKDLGNVGNNTYNINGVTYDDGSNVSDAVKVLVRAAKVERRR